MSVNSAVLAPKEVASSKRTTHLIWVVARRTAIVFAIFFMLLLLAEGALRLWYRMPIVERYFAPASNVAGYGLARSVHYEYFHYIRRVFITTDASGRRVVPGAPAAAPHTLHVIGDSQVFGWGLSDNETISARLQQLLGPEWRVTNEGVPGYGPFSYAEALRNMPQSDFAVVIQAEVNDFQDALTARSALYSKCGYLVTRSTLAKVLPCWVLSSYLFAEVTTLVIKENHELPLPLGYSPYSVPAAKVLQYRADNLYRDGLGDPPKRAIFAIVPWDAAILPGRLVNYWPRLDHAKRLVGLPDQLNVETVFRNARNRGILFQQNDSHLSPAGANLFAEQLAPVVRAMAATPAQHK